MANPVTLDFSKATPIPKPSSGVTLDFSKATPINQPAQQETPPPAPGIAKLDLKYVPAIDSPAKLVSGAWSGVKNMFAHPWQTASGMGQAFTASGMAPEGMYPATAPLGTGKTGQQSDWLNNKVQQSAQQSQADQGNYAVGHPMETAGNVIGPALVTAGAAKAFKFAAPRVGSALVDLGDSNLNTRMNVGAKDTQYGQNPARGIRNSGIGVSTQSGLLNKVSGAQDANGALISNAVQRADINANAPKITPGQLKPLIEGPVKSQIGVVRGIGNHSVNAEAPLNAFLDKAQQPAPGAKAPIYGPNAPSEILPTDLWKSIRNIDKNTRFNPAPEVETVNEVGRSVRGGLRNVLETTDPTIRPLSQNYSDLVSGENALSRQQAPYYAPHGIKSLFANTLNSYPVRTAISAGLWKTGSALNQLGGSPAMGSAAPIFAPKMYVKPLQLGADTIGNSGYGGDFSQGSIPSRNPIAPPAPASRLALPASVNAPESQPMIGVKAPSTYPSLFEDAARMRVAPSKSQLGRMGGSLKQNRGLYLPPSE